MVATDEVAMNGGAAAHVQYVKLVSSTNGSTDLPGELDHGTTVSLFVHPRPDTVIVATPQNSAGLTTASTAYSAGDTLGNGWTIANAAKASGGTGRVIGFDIRDYADVTDVITLWFFQGSVTFGTDNSAPSISDADSLKYVGQQVVSTSDLGGVRVGSVNSISIPYILDGTDLYVYATTNGAGHTFFGAATDLRLRVHVTRD